MMKLSAALLASLLAATTALGAAPAVAASAPDLEREVAPVAAAALPTRTEALDAAATALDYFYANDGGATANDGWRWTPFFMGAEALYRETGNAKYRSWIQSWGDRNRWLASTPATPTSNPDSRAAMQVWYDAVADGVTVDLVPSDELMAADLAVPAPTYWWIDALFMGLPLWPRWEERTGDPAYAAKHAEFYTYLKTQGATSWRPGCPNTGLFDETEDLWWRDCKYVPERDALGNKVFWSRGNGWTLAALARTLMVLPPTDPQYAEYRSMMQRMSARVAELQGPDGMWRTNLLSPSLHPAPETSGTALFTYAMAHGIRTGVLDRATYLPVVTKAWAGLTEVGLTESGFVSNCQLVAEAPGNPSTTTSIAYCVGAFALAAVEMAKLGDVLASDAFTRTGTNGLGTAATGGVWTMPSNPASYAVNAGRARISTPAGTTRNAFQSGVSSVRTDLRATVSFGRPTLGSAYVGVQGRRVGESDYSGRVVVNPTGAMRLQLRRTDATLATAAVPHITYAAGDRLTLRLQVVGTSPTTLRAKVWRAGTAEPAGWQLTATDSTAALQGPGAIALTTYLSAAGRPNTLGVTFDDVSARRSG
ncbi:glycoside hydrolase family 88 protein [Planctomonas psychrotolerans]|uniref:glycoside hydrolase family 88 protein n=1 Tax=Planctomonas psychrotolerans TaxID=2528712 RepID=UPI00123942B3|nr:glycoside hydrolase family 88 protein [Planctomonas psychrotolerans]